MAKLNWEKQSRKERGVQRDGAYSSYGGKLPKIRKPAVGKFTKYDGKWAVSVVADHSLPSNGRLIVEKKDGSMTVVHIEDWIGSKKLEFCVLNFYTFSNVE